MHVVLRDQVDRVFYRSGGDGISFEEGTNCDNESNSPKSNTEPELVTRVDILSLLYLSDNFCWICWERSGPRVRISAWVNEFPACRC